MKKIIIRSAEFILILVIILLAIDLISFTDIGDDYLGRLFFATGYRNVGSYQISPAIETVRKESEHTKLILGDSVCNQVFASFKEANSDYLIVGTNAGVGMTGQYILGKLFLESHPEATDIYIVAIPSSFPIGNRSKHTFSYLVEPFGKEGLLSYLDPETVDELGSIYGKPFMNPKVLAFMDGSCINNKLLLYYYKKNTDIHDGDIMSDEAAHYLEKLMSECESRNVKLHILPGPVKDTEELHERYENLKKVLEGTSVESLFDRYFDSTIYYPSEYFGDGTHFSEKYITDDLFADIILELQQRSGELEGIILEQ